MLAREEFISGDFDTGFIESKFTGVERSTDPRPSAPRHRRGDRHPRRRAAGAPAGGRRGGMKPVAAHGPPRRYEPRPLMSTRYIVHQGERSRP